MLEFRTYHARPFDYYLLPKKKVLMFLNTSTFCFIDMFQINLIIYFIFYFRIEDLFCNWHTLSNEMKQKMVNLLSMLYMKKIIQIKFLIEIWSWLGQKPKYFEWIFHWLYWIPIHSFVYLNMQK